MSDKKYIWNWTRILSIFHFRLFIWKALRPYAFGSFTYLYYEKCMSCFSAFSCSTYFVRIAKWKLPLFSSASFSSVEDNSFVRLTLRVTTAVDLHLNATYAQKAALKSLYEKYQSVLGGKSFTSSKIFEIHDSKTNALNCLYDVLVHNEALIIYHDRVFAWSFLRVLSWPLVLERFVQLCYPDNGM